MSFQISFPETQLNTPTKVIRATKSTEPISIPKVTKIGSDILKKNLSNIITGRSIANIPPSQKQLIYSHSRIFQFTCEEDHPLDKLENDFPIGSYTSDADFSEENLLEKIQPNPNSKENDSLLKSQDPYLNRYPFVQAELSGLSNKENFSIQSMQSTSPGTESPIKMKSSLMEEETSETEFALFHMED